MTKHRSGAEIRLADEVKRLSARQKRSQRWGARDKGRAHTHTRMQAGCKGGGRGGEGTKGGGGVD